MKIKPRTFICGPQALVIVTLWLFMGKVDAVRVLIICELLMVAVGDIDQGFASTFFIWTKVTCVGAWFCPFR